MSADCKAVLVWDGSVPERHTHSGGDNEESMQDDLGDATALLERALPMLIRLGDYIGNGDIDPNRPDSLGIRCDLIGDIRMLLRLRGAATGEETRT